jgi:sarcosine oxidase gamma subunit
MDKINQLPLSSVKDGLSSINAMTNTNVEISIVNGLRILSLRHLVGGKSELLAALAESAFLELPKPQQFFGTDPCLLWRSNNEYLFITTDVSLSNSLLTALGARTHPLVYALDQTSGCVVFELRGAGVGSLLQRVIDNAAIPKVAGEGYTTRFADVSVTILRRDPSLVWIKADKSHEPYIWQWLDYANRGMQSRVNDNFPPLSAFDV